MARKKKKPTKEVALGGVAEEKQLPLPVVYYPGHYGSFFSFAENENSEIYFCSCAKEAIKNCIRFTIESNDYLNKNNYPQNIFYNQIPKIISDELIRRNVDINERIINYFNFKDGICHECNKVTPSLSYCHPMYGGSFKRNYGWYIGKQSYEYGVGPVFCEILEDVCPGEVFSLLEDGKEAFLKRYNSLSGVDLMFAQRSSEFLKAARKIQKLIENEVRVKFGFKKVGEAWTAETLLYELVCQILPNEKLFRHYRPEFLGFLELDVFIPRLKLGIEYQGLQHFKPVKHWGGKNGLLRVQKRDKKKKKLCYENGIKLIYFYYNEELSKELVESKINPS